MPEGDCNTTPRAKILPIRETLRRLKYVYWYFDILHLRNNWNTNNIFYQERHSNKVWKVMKTLLTVCLIVWITNLYSTDGKYYLIETHDGSIFFGYPVWSYDHIENYIFEWHEGVGDCSSITQESFLFLNTLSTRLRLQCKTPVW